MAGQLQAIRESLLWILPCLMIISLLLFVASIGEFIYGRDNPQIQILFRLYNFVSGLFPILLTAALAYILAMRWRLPRPPIALVLIVYLSLFDQLVGLQGSAIVFELLLALITPLYAVPMIAYIYGQRWTKFVTNDHLGHIVKEALNLILPCLVVGLVVLMLNASFIYALESSQILTHFSIDYADSPLGFGVIFATLNSLFWFLGVWLLRLITDGGGVISSG
ncbi:hypothetical protein [Vibrio taketomensis]|uniref:hypothetical protein n=1 Tax=Vibrio taketomensis TaxID=2572923 RepID=UPI001E61DDC9|nr:hypothetical protein [Vibrio taketomensis]